MDPSEKSRGVIPPVFVVPTSETMPVVSSIENTAMLSSPRLDAKTKCPEGWTHTSAPVFVPVKPEGKVDTVWRAERVPCTGSRE